MSCHEPQKGRHLNAIVCHYATTSDLNKLFFRPSVLNYNPFKNIDFGVKNSFLRLSELMSLNPINY